jgi:hypothetical protein
VYLVTKIVLWKPSSMMGDYGWGAALAHFFVGTHPYYPEEDVTVPFYTSLAYSMGALLERSNVFRFRHPDEDRGR